MTLYWVAFGLKIAAAIAAIVVARKRPEHRSVAAFLAGTSAIDIARLGLITWIIAPARAAIRAAGLNPADVPFTGLARVACDVDGALFLLWPAGLAALALSVYLKRRPWAVLALWVLVSAALAVTYPSVRGDGLGRVYLAAELAALATSIGAFVVWVRRHEGRGLHHTVVMFIVFMDIALLVAPWREGLFVRWDLAQVMYAALYAALAVLQGGAAWIRSSRTA